MLKPMKNGGKYFVRVRNVGLSGTGLRDIVQESARKAGLKYWNYIKPKSLRKVFINSILKDQPSELKLDEKDQKFLRGHLQSGSMESYYDDSKIEKMRKNDL